MSRLRIVVDRARCMGAGECVATAPASFRLGEDDKAWVIEPAADDAETLRKAARGCPNFAIRIEV